jgi:hypothetical protein
MISTAFGKTECAGIVKPMPVFRHIFLLVPFRSTGKGGKKKAGDNRTYPFCILTFMGGQWFGVINSP